MGVRGFPWIGGIHGVLRPVGVSGDVSIPMGAHGLLWIGGIHGILRLVGAQELMLPVPLRHVMLSELNDIFGGADR